jgi:hypothetical protein
VNHEQSRQQRRPTEGRGEPVGAPQALTDLNVVLQRFERFLVPLEERTCEEQACGDASQDERTSVATNGTGEPASAS